MKRETLIVFIITFMLLAPLSSLGIFGVPRAHTLEERDYIISDANWLDDYQFRKSHDITGSVGAETDYQVLINVTRATGSDTGNNVFVGTNCKTDFGDIRFTDNDKITELDYWIQTNTTEYGMFWVEVSDDLDSNQVIYIYYGDDAVSTTSDGDDTFVFYEDWSSESVRPAVWDTQENDGYIYFHDVLDGADELYGEEAHGRWILEVGGGTGTDTEYYRTDARQTAPMALLFRANIESTVAASQTTRIGLGNPNEASMTIVKSAEGSHSFEVIDDDINSDHQVMDAEHFGDYHTFEITRDGTTAKLYIDGVLDETASCSPDVNSVTWASIFVKDSEYQVYSDWFAGRKFVAVEPTHSTWGNEEEDSRGWRSIALAVLEVDMPGWNSIATVPINFFIPINELTITYLLMLGGIVMIPTSTVLLVKGGRSDMSRDKLFLFFLMFLFGWALFLGGVM